MADNPAVVTQGTTLWRMSDDRTWDRVNGITSFNGPNMSKNKIDVSTFASTRREYLYGMTDEGDISMNAFFYPTDPIHRQMMTIDIPSHENRDWRLELSDGTAYEFSGNLTGAPISGEIDGAVAWSLTLSISGEPSWTFSDGEGTMTYFFRNFIGDSKTVANETDPFDKSPITKGRIHGFVYIDLKDTDTTEKYFIDPSTPTDSTSGWIQGTKLTGAASENYDGAIHRNWIRNWIGGKFNTSTSYIYTRGVHYDVTIGGIGGSELSTANLDSKLIYVRSYGNGKRLILTFDLIGDSEDGGTASGTALGSNTTLTLRLLPNGGSGNDATSNIIHGLASPTSYPETEIMGAKKDIFVPFGSYDKANGSRTYSMD